MNFGYEIEASAHCTDLDKFFNEVYRTLKPGGKFAGYAWCSTPYYNSSDANHKKIMDDITYGNSMPCIYEFSAFIKAIENSGLILEEEKDLALEEQIPWYNPLDGKYTISGFKSTKLGRICTNYLVYFMESFRLAPKGSYQAHNILQIAADGLLNGGQQEIFTPMHFYKVRKPE